MKYGKIINVSEPSTDLSLYVVTLYANFEGSLPNFEEKLNFSYIFLGNFNTVSFKSYKHYAERMMMKFDKLTMLYDFEPKSVYTPLTLHDEV